MQPEKLRTIAAKEQLLRRLGFILFFAMHSVSAVFFQALNVAQEQISLSVAAYFTGLLCSALALPSLERHMASPGGRGKAWRVAVFCGMLLPGFLYLFLPAVGHTAPGIIQASAIVQPFFAALLLPIAFRLFFHPLLSEFHCIFFGLAMAMGHLCWALLTPMFLHSATGALLDTFDDAYLPFLKLLHYAFNAGFALVVWHVVRYTTKAPLEKRRSPETPPQERCSPAAFRAFLVPFFLCFLLNGLLGDTLFVRLRVNTGHLQYLHLGLTALFLLMGFYLSTKGTKALRTFLTLSIVCVAPAPLLLYLPPSSPAYSLIHFVYGMSNQALVFSGALVCGVLSLHSKRPALVASATWLTAFATLLGQLFVEHAAPALSLSPLALACLCAALCILSLPLTGRVFPLPRLAAPVPAPANPPAAAENEANRRLHTYAAQHKLNERERQIAAMLMQGRSTSEMAHLMNLKENSVRTYTQNLLKKTGSANRATLIIALLAPPEAEHTQTPPHPETLSPPFSV